MKPVDPADHEREVADILEATAGVLHEQGKVALCTLIRTEGSTPGKPGWRLLVAPDGRRIGNLGGGAFEAMVSTDAAELLTQAAAAPSVKRYYLTEKAVHGEATGMVCGGMAEVFLEVMRDKARLLVFGAGPVGQALARAGALAGFELTVVDDRQDYRAPELFPEGTTLPAVERDFEGDYWPRLLRAPLFVAVVSRCWETDVAALAAVLRAGPADLRYLGLMGSRRKIDRVREELTGQGLELPDDLLRAPIGLDLGGDTPGEIAISIVAEMQAVRHGSASASLRKTRDR